MPTFHTIAPDGREYDIEGADMAGAFAALQKMRGHPPLPPGFQLDRPGTPVTDPHILAQLNAPPLPEGFRLDQRVTDPGLIAQLEAGFSTAGDVLKSAGAGLAKGVMGLAGLPGDAQRGVEWLNDWGRGKLGLPPLSDATKARLHAGLPSSSQIQSGVEGVTGEFYKPQTTPGRYADTASISG
jgi:hypothetical protein